MSCKLLTHQVLSCNSAHLLRRIRSRIALQSSSPSPLLWAGQPTTYILHRTAFGSLPRGKTMNKQRRGAIRGGDWTRPTHFPYPLPPESYELVNEDVLPNSKTLTEYEEVEGAFELVKRLLPNPIIPIPPVHAVYPTPSGYIPAGTVKPDMPYHVTRSSHHNLPVYLEKHVHETKLLTKVLRVEGDIWRFKDDLLKYLEPVNKYPYPIEQHPCQVSEVDRLVRIKGNYVMEVKRFLLEKGF